MRHDVDVSHPRYANLAQALAALDPDEPLIAFDSARLKRQARAFLSGFAGDVAFAVKSNPSPEVIACLAQAGVATFDVASLEEMRMVRAMAPQARLHYHNPVKSRREIATAYDEFGCRRFAVDDAGELAKITRVVTPFAAGDVEIAVRFRLSAHAGAVHDFSSKFGADRQHAQSLLQAAGESGFTPVLTFHPGSQCLDPEAWRRHIAAAAEIATGAGVSIAKLNVGGGFPTPRPRCDVPALETIFTTIEEAVAEAFAPALRPHIECEPGRAMVADCMNLATRVKLVRPQTRELFINDGIYGHLLEPYQESRLRPAARHLASPPRRSAPPVAWTIFGPTCDPLDRLPGTWPLPADTAEGDFIIFEGLGAYAAATCTRFNGYGHADWIEICDR